MKLAIANDHRGYKLKKELYRYLKERYDITDLGTDSEERTDYTKYAFKLGERVANKEYDYGILICGSGIGISIACNKVKGIRCAKVNNEEEAYLTRKDNNANVVAFSGTTNINDAIRIVEKFLMTPFEKNERYIKRIKDITDYENGEYNES